jgi:hypothetical protein
VRKIVVGGLLSLDGVAEDPNRFFTEWDEVVDASIPRLIATQDAVILGRRGYDEWVGFWPGSEIEPFATFIKGVVCRDLRAAGAAVDERARDRRRSCRVRAVPEGRSWRRHWRARQYLGRAGAAGRRPCRRTPARDRSEHRRRRTTTLRRAAADPVEIDPERDLADWLSARRLSPYSLELEKTA